jgi:L-threonylcarbamoyladenylate synthase
MMRERNDEWKSTARAVRDGAIAVVPTDTLYGIIASAKIPEAVERLYRVRGRDAKKPCIVLLSCLEDMSVFVPEEMFSRYANILRTVWPDAVSVIISDIATKWEYLHRGSQSLAFRIPNNKHLQTFLRETGPVIAPSANPQGKEPAKTIVEAKEYFGDRVDHYVDGGALRGLPSTLLAISNRGILPIREGVVSFEDISRRVDEFFS